MSTGEPPGADATATGDGGRRDRRGRIGDHGAQAQAPAPKGPTTETLEMLRGRLPLSIRLIGRSSVPGALVVLGLALVLIAAVPLAAKLQLNAVQAAGEEIPVGNVIDLTIANDWSIESQDGRATVLSSGSSQLVIVPAYEESRTAAAVATAEIATVASDASASWVVGDPASFTTTAGDPGTTVSASSETRATQVWAVTHEGLATVAVLTTTIESWASAQPRVQEMVDSIEISSGAGASGAQP